MGSAKRRTRIKPDRRATTTIVIGVVLVALAGLAIWQQRQAAEEGAALPDPDTTVMSSPRDPSESTPPEAMPYQVAADQPRSIDLPSIQSAGPIQRVGLGNDGAVVAPTNINFAGWYVAEAKPGDDGVSLIGGHVQGRHKPGIFKQLNRLGAGDRFSVEFGDRSRRQFEVVRTQSYPLEQVSQHLLTQDPDIRQQLNLITCDGTFDQQRDTYRNRLLVVAKRVD